MSEYGKMKPLQRARLKQSDPKRFERIKAQHDTQEQALKIMLSEAKNHEEYKARQRDLQLFNEGGDPFDLSLKPSGSAA